jgi:hypothetical protein
MDGRLRWEGDSSPVELDLRGALGQAAGLRGAGDLLYGSYLGGGSWEEGLGAAVDREGNVYVSGWTQSTDLAATPGAFDTTYGGARDAFIAKFGAGGLAYLAFLGGSDEDWGYGLAVGADGSAYLAGATKSSNFPTTPGSLAPGYRGGPSDGFLTKIAPDGRSLLYSTFIGGSGEDIVRAVAVDGSGNAYLTGWTESSDFPKTPGAFDVSMNSNWDAFALKLNAAGSQLLYGSYLGGSFDERGLDIAVDALGCVYITGYTMSSDFPISAGAYDPSYDAGLGDAFATKLNAAGSALGYSTFLGGNGEDKARGIAVDAAGCAYVSGITRSSDFATTPGAFGQTSGGNQDIFLVKLNALGGAAEYATLLGGSLDDHGYDIAIDTLGCAYIIGATKSSNYPTTAGAYDTTFNGAFTFQNDAVLTKLNPQGSALLYSSYLGGAQLDAGYALAVDDQQTAYITGYTASSDFPTTEGAFDRARGGQGDAFLIKLATLAQTPTPTTTASATATPTATRTTTATRTATGSATTVLSPTATASRTATATRTSTVAPTNTSTPTAMLSPTATATPTLSPTPALTASPTGAPPWRISLPLLLKNRSG